MTNLRVRLALVACLAAAVVPATARADKPADLKNPVAAAKATASTPPKPAKPKPPKTPPAPPAPAGAGVQHVEGVVQSMTPAVVVVRQLDGRPVSVPYDPKTRFFVDGRKAKAGDVKAGYVLVVSWKTGKPAATLRFVRPG